MKHLIAIFSVLLVTSSASAAVIDFTGSEAARLDGKTSEHTTIDGVGLTATAGPCGLLACASIEQSGWGLGVDYYDSSFGGAQYQIEGSEILTIDFDQAQFVTGFTVTNLYDWGFLGLQVEVGEFTIDGSNYEQFVAQNANGVLSFDLGSVETTSISFRAQGSWFDLNDNGFTLAAITTEPDAVTDVPELDPGAMPGAVAVLVGTTLILRERRREHA